MFVGQVGIQLLSSSLLRLLLFVISKKKNWTSFCAFLKCERRVLRSMGPLVGPIQTSKSSPVWVQVQEGVPRVLFRRPEVQEFL